MRTIAIIGAHFKFLFKLNSVTANNAAATAASKDAINESSRYIPFHVPAGKRAQMAMATMSKTMFAATSASAFYAKNLALESITYGRRAFFNLVRATKRCTT